MRAGSSTHEADRGAILIIVLMIAAFVSTLALSLALTSDADTVAAFSYQNSQRALLAAEAGIELAMAELGRTADWDAVLAGSVQAPSADGPPSGTRVLADGRRIDLGAIASLATCGNAKGCTPAAVAQVTEARPWGPNNPRWQPYWYGSLASVAPEAPTHTAVYIVVLVADDGAENDGDWARDGGGTENPGAGVLRLRAEAFGVSRSHRVVEAVVQREAAAGPGGLALRLIGWQEVR